jgi:hypothetical protein
MASAVKPVFGGLHGRELAELEELADRDPRTLSEDDLAMLDGLSRGGLYRDDDGRMPEVSDVPYRDDLSEEQRDWLVRLGVAVFWEKRRRLKLREALRQRPADSPVVERASERRPAARVRPREQRSRRTTRSRARAPARSTGSDSDDPEPVDDPGGRRVSGLVLELRSMQGAGRDWPRYREGARRDERAWIESLSDGELARLAAELHAVDKAVKTFHESDHGNGFHDPRKDAA